MQPEVTLHASRQASKLGKPVYVMKTPLAYHWLEYSWKVLPFCEVYVAGNTLPVGVGVLDVEEPVVVRVEGAVDVKICVDEENNVEVVMGGSVNSVDSVDSVASVDSVDKDMGIDADVGMASVADAEVAMSMLIAIDVGVLVLRVVPIS